MWRPARTILLRVHGPQPGVGSTIGPYRIDAVLGQGGMGVVYPAEHLRLRRAVALKVLDSKLVRDEEFRERFLRESRIAAGLEHPGVVSVYDAGEVDGQPYIAMRFVDGSDLAALLEHDGALAPGEAVTIVERRRARATAPAAPAAGCP